MIQEWPSVSCYHQKQHLLKLEAYNTMSCNFSAKEARIHQKIKTLTTSTRRCFSTLTYAFSGGFLAQKSTGSFKHLSKLSSTLQHLLITSDWAIGSGDILVASFVLHIGRLDIVDTGEAKPYGSQRRRPHDPR